MTGPALGKPRADGAAHTRSTSSAPQTAIQQREIRSDLAHAHRLIVKRFPIEPKIHTSCLQVGRCVDPVGTDPTFRETACQADEAPKTDVEHAAWSPRVRPA